MHRLILTSAAWQQSSVAADVRRLTSFHANGVASRRINEPPHVGCYGFRVRQRFCHAPFGDLTFTGGGTASIARRVWCPPFRVRRVELVPGGNTPGQPLHPPEGWTPNFDYISVSRSITRAACVEPAVKSLAPRSIRVPGSRPLISHPSPQ